MSLPKYTEPPTYAEACQLTQANYGDVFHPNRSPDIRNLIFKFKWESRLEVVEKTLKSFCQYTGWNDAKPNFKKYSQTKTHPAYLPIIGGIHFPIKNRKELYILYRDWIIGMDYLKISPNFNDRKLAYSEYKTSPIDIWRLSRQLVEKLMGITDFSIGCDQEEVWKVLRTNDNFDKKCKELMEKTSPIRVRK